MQRNVNIDIKSLRMGILKNKFDLWWGWNRGPLPFQSNPPLSELSCEVLVEGYLT